MTNEAYIEKIYVNVYGVAVSFSETIIPLFEAKKILEGTESISDEELEDLPVATVDPNTGAYLFARGNAFAVALPVGGDPSDYEYVTISREDFDTLI